MGLSGKLETVRNDNESKKSYIFYISERLAKESTRLVKIKDKNSYPIIALTKGNVFQEHYIFLCFIEG